MHLKFKNHQGNKQQILNQLYCSRDIGIPQNPIKFQPPGVDSFQYTLRVP